MKVYITAYTICTNQEIKSQLVSYCENIGVDLVFADYQIIKEPPELIQFLREARYAVVGREKIAGPQLDQLVHLKKIIKYGVGLDNIDLDKCRRRKVDVSRQDGINADSVCEFTLGLMLSSLHNISSSFLKLKKGEWKRPSGNLLAEKTVAIIGAGAIGSRVARLCAQGFGAQVLINDIIDKTIIAREIGAQILEFDRACQQADIISFHVPLSSQTTSMLNEEKMQNLKKSVLIVNTSRGEVIDNRALVEFLQKNPRARAALDVYPKEPLADESLRALDNVLLTPHIAGSAIEATTRMIKDIAHKIKQLKYEESHDRKN